MKKELGKLNVKLFGFVMQAILDEPKRMNMDLWLKTHLTEAKIKAEEAEQMADGYGGLRGDIKALVKHLPQGLPECGTVGCIGGWAVSLNTETGKLVKRPRWDWITAQKRLGLTEDQADHLFYLDYWPYQFQERLKKHKPGTIGYTKTVVARMKYFLRTGE